MAEFNLQEIIQTGVGQVLNEPFLDGKSIIEWAAIGKKASGWISVQDRLPEHVDRVPVLYRFADSELQDGKLHTAMLWYVREPFCGDEPPHWERIGRYEYEVLYWFELPEQPEEVSGND